MSSKKKKSKKQTSDIPTSVGISNKKEMEYMAEEDLRTLRRAREIETDKKRLMMAKKIAKKEIEALSLVSSFKDYIKKADKRGISN